MTQNVIQTSFAAGEVSPSLYARVDLSKYHVGLAYCRNFFVDVRGGATSRPGSMFVGQAYKSTTQVRLIPFQFSTQQTYALEFGDVYMRIISNGAYVLETAQSITAITDANPGVFTAAAHGYNNNDWVFLLVPTGPTQLNTITGIVQNVTTNTFTLTDLFGNNINTTGYPAYTSGATVARYYTVVSPFAAADLSLVKYFQSADIITLTHPSYPPYDLVRSGPTSWSFNAITFAAAVQPPNSLAVSASVTGHTTTYRYVVTSISSTGEESIASGSAGVNNSDTMSQNVAAHEVVTWGAPGSGPAPIQYNIYRQREVPGGAPDYSEAYGYVGYTLGTTFTDVNIAPDFTQTPPTHQNPFASSNYPGCGCYFQQRKCFGGPANNPETFYMSQPGNFTNMDTHNPVEDSDAITGTIASQQVNAIKHMVPMNSLIVLSQSGAWQVTGGTITAAITPSTITAQPQAYNGCSDVQPLIINYDILYVQAKGSIVRDLAYNFYVNVYTGSDLSTLSSHLFFGHQILEWCWQEEPWKTVWAIREDGQMLSLAYLKEQDVYGWAHHDTSGYFKSVCAVSEGQQNAVYYVVQRYVQGQWVQYIERAANRILNGNIENAWCVDAGLSYPLTYPSASLSMTANADGSPLAVGSTITFTASAAVFSGTSTDVGNIIRVSNGKAHITAAISTTQVTAVVDVITTTTLPAASGTWSCTTPVNKVSGLNHLIGRTVAILADGGVVASQPVDSTGSVTLQKAATCIVVGLPFQCQLQTLYLDVGTPTIQGKRKKIATVTLRLYETRGLKAGYSFPTVVEGKESYNTQPTGTPPVLITGDQRINITPQYNTGGQVSVQQDYPLPASVLGLIPEIVVGDT